MKINEPTYVNGKVLCFQKPPPRQRMIHILCCAHCCAPLYFYHVKTSKKMGSLLPWAAVDIVSSPTGARLTMTAELEVCLWISALCLSHASNSVAGVFHSSTYYHHTNTHWRKATIWLSHRENQIVFDVKKHIFLKLPRTLNWIENRLSKFLVNFDFLSSNFLDSRLTAKTNSLIWQPLSKSLMHIGVPKSCTVGKNPFDWWCGKNMVAGLPCPESH